MPEGEFILGADPQSPRGAAAMPCGRVHIMCGASGSNKTTALMQMLLAMQAGKPFQGYPTKWLPTVYVAFDREEEETHETMARVGIDPQSIPQFYPVVELPDAGQAKDTRLEAVVSAILGRWPGTKFIIFDAFFILAAHGQINNYLFMAEWLQRARKLCKDRGLTILGVVHSPKQREGERILDPRQQIQGTVAGAGFTSCTMVMENVARRGDDPEGLQRRAMHILPRNSPERKFEFVLDANGCLTADTKDEADRMHILVELFDQLREGESLTTSQIQATMSRLGVTDRTVRNYLATLEEAGKICKVKHGRWALGPLGPIDTPWTVAGGGDA